MLVFAESGGFCSYEVVELIVVIVDEVETDSFIEEGFFGLVGGEEGGYRFIVEGGDGLGGLVIVKVIFQSGSAFF